jgi:ABC-type uncharacterized transport system permease subunit
MSAPYAKLPAWVDYGLIPLINLVVAFMVAGLVVLAVGESPLRAASLLIEGAFGYGEGIGFTLYYATNFIFTGLAVAVAFHCGLFNIGGEGQAYVAGLGVALPSSGSTRSCPGMWCFPQLFWARPWSALPGRLFRDGCRPSAAATWSSPRSCSTSSLRA